MDEVMDAARTGVLAGATWGSIVAAWESKPVAGQQTGALVFSTTRTIASNAGKLGLFAALFAAAKKTSQEVRGTQDPVNSFVGGCVAGGLAGAQSGKVPMGVAGCLLAGSAAALAATSSGRSEEEKAPFAFVDEFKKATH